MDSSKLNESSPIMMHVDNVHFGWEDFQQAVTEMLQADEELIQPIITDIPPLEFMELPPASLFPAKDTVLDFLAYNQACSIPLDIFSSGLPR